MKAEYKKFKNLFQNEIKKQRKQPLNTKNNSNEHLITNLSKLLHYTFCPVSLFGAEYWCIMDTMS